MRSLKGEGTISVETPSLAQSGSFALTLRKPDSVLLNLRGPFGIRLGIALLTRQGFLFYNSIKNQLISGSTNNKNLSRIFRVNLSFDDILNLFTGGIFFADDLHTPDETRVEEEQFVLFYRSGEGGRQYWIDPPSLLIRKIQFLDRDGKLTFEQSFSNFQTFDGVVLPSTIRVVQPKERQMVALVYSELSVNTDPIQFTLNIPSNAERIRW
jgi:hypothetical protein